jgi:hypothetical protein
MAPSLPAVATPTRFSAGLSTSARLRNVLGAVTTMSALVATFIVKSARAVAAGRHGHGSPVHAEVDQTDGQLGGADRHVSERVDSLAVGHDLQDLAAPGWPQVDADTGQHAAGLIGNPAGHGADALGPRR